MSVEATPIPPHLFATAIKDLPLSNVYAKAAELQNSISHLLASNVEMAPFAAEGDEICREAIAENDAVVARMEERIRLCQAEVEGRGARWSEHAAGEKEPGEAPEEEVRVNGDGRGDGRGDGPGANGHAEGRAPSGRLTDEELRRELERRMGGMDDEEDGDGDGVHL